MAENNKTKDISIKPNNVKGSTKKDIALAIIISALIISIAILSTSSSIQLSYIPKSNFDNLTIDVNITNNVTDPVKVEIVQPVNDEGFVEVRAMETTNEIIDVKLINVEGNATLNQSLSENDRIAYFNTGHGISNQDVMNFYCENRIVQINAENVSGNNITLAMPSDIDCNTTELIEYGRSNANVIGNITTPTEFCFRTYWNKTYHINRMLITIRDGTAMDDGTFGGLPKLDFPVVYRVYDGFAKNLFPASRNGAFALRAYDVEYASKAPAGEYAVRIRRSFGGADKNGAVIELNGNNQDMFCKSIPVDLTGLTDYETVIQGHVGESR